ncbi:ATP-grasp domain-containing protein [Candidatus Woesearchaeota archaeon]|nr:ATP-grasp domain-containing protein [Candidatus Woesearchaeota archaeon]MBW3016944.1 ATP-grasp domain-containing protein [Candidatus Woesearchaeota archaeon]
MKVAVLSNVFKDFENKEVEEDLTQVGKAVLESLTKFGYEVSFFDVNERTFEKLRKADIDIAFNVCERFNGSSFHEPHVAAMLELLGIPYTGSSPMTLALCMNKSRVKEILTHNGIPTPKFQVFDTRYKKLDPELKFPLIVKPNCMDNSIGITKNAIVRNEAQLRKRISYILRMYNQPALVEEYIFGREFAVGVLGNGTDAEVLPIFEHSFEQYEDRDFRILDYDSKWAQTSGEYMYVLEHCPAKLPKYIEQRIKKICLDVHKLLDVRDYGRVDLRLAQDGTPYVLEMNPNPGISVDCQIPIAAKSLGLTYHEMIHEIFKKALDRYKIKVEKVEEKIENPINSAVTN